MSFQKSIDRLVRNRWYTTGPLAAVDWVGGGNFEGHIYRHSLRFSADDDTVEMRTERLAERGTGQQPVEIRVGCYGPAQKGSIGITFERGYINGFVLGEENEYIACHVNWAVQPKRFYPRGYVLEGKE